MADRPIGGRGTTRWVRSLRPRKPPVDPWHALGHFWEEERVGGAGTLSVLTVLLAGAECLFTCVFCDLWRRTLDGPTPLGALPGQLDEVIRLAGPVPDGAGIKLYNASNFFDPRAVPPADDPAVALAVAPFRRVTVECHPRFVGARCVEFARRLAGRLEVAIGLETVHPTALPRLNKSMRLADFDRAAGFLREAGIALRAFVLLAPPFVPATEAVDWAVRSVGHAIERGAAHVSLIPVRGGNGALEALARNGEFVSPTLGQLEDALDRSVDLGPAVVTADLWDAHALPACAECRNPRLARLRRINLTGRREPRASCRSCSPE